MPKITTYIYHSYALYKPYLTLFGEYNGVLSTKPISNLWQDQWDDLYLSLSDSPQSYRNKPNVTIYTAQSDFEYQTQMNLYTKSISYFTSCPSYQFQSDFIPCLIEFFYTRHNKVTVPCNPIGTLFYQPHQNLCKEPSVSPF